MPNVKSPSVQQHQALQNAFHYFNKELFQGKLVTCMLNLSRKSKSNGWYCAAVWFNGVRQAAEISLNPDHMKRPLIEVYSTLVHEMVHHWQEMNGSSPRRGYHDKEWADKMFSIGLHPCSSDGQGRTVGQKMTHVIAPGGPFEIAFDAMNAKLAMPYLPVSLEKVEKAKKAAANKVKYTCPVCECNVWGKPSLLLGCLACEETMTYSEG